MEATLIQKGWWASKSTGSKIGIVALAAAAIAGISYGIYRLVTPKEDAGWTNPALETDAEKEEAVLAEHKAETKEVISDASTLPNKGVDCSQIYGNYDKDYDYVKCAGIWYAKSKANAISASAKGKFKDWSSLEKAPVATDRLNRRYPDTKK